MAWVGYHTGMWDLSSNVSLICSSLSCRAWDGSTMRCMSRNLTFYCSSRCSSIPSFDFTNDFVGAHLTTSLLCNNKPFIERYRNWSIRGDIPLWSFMIHTFIVLLPGGPQKLYDWSGMRQSFDFPFPPIPLTCSIQALYVPHKLLALVSFADTLTTLVWLSDHIIG